MKVYVNGEVVAEGDISVSIVHGESEHTFIDVSAPTSSTLKIRSFGKIKNEYTKIGSDHGEFEAILKVDKNS